MTMLYELPSVLKNHIYEYDNTYRLKYNEVMENIESDELKLVRTVLYNKVDNWVFYNILEIKQIQNEFLVQYNNGEGNYEEERYRVEIPSQEIIKGVMKEYLINMNPCQLKKYVKLSSTAIQILQKEMDSQECMNEFYDMIEDWDTFVSDNIDKEEVIDMFKEHYRMCGYDAVYYCHRYKYGLTQDMYIVCSDDVLWCHYDIDF